MRTLIAISLVALFTSAAAASPAASKAANGRGMTLMGKKKWAEAEKEFKTAVAEDNTSVKAHYNLASAASRAQDRATAIGEIAWVIDRGTWVDEARRAAKKADSDPDLEWALSNWGDPVFDWSGAHARTAPVDLLDEQHLSLSGHAGGDGKKLAAAPGNHDAKCDPKNDKQGKVFTRPLGTGSLQKLHALASLRDGIALVDESGAIVARSEPLGCTGPGESQDQLATLTVAFGSLLQVDVGDDPSSTVEPQRLVVTYTNGGRREWQTNVAIFARKDNAMVKVFENPLVTSDSASSGHLWQTPLGHLLYSGPGETKKHAYEWDPKAFKFVEIP